MIWVLSQLDLATLDLPPTIASEAISGCTERYEGVCALYYWTQQMSLTGWSWRRD